MIAELPKIEARAEKVKPVSAVLNGETGFFIQIPPASTMLDQRSLVAQNLILTNQSQDESQIATSRIRLFDADACLCEELAQMLQQSGYYVTAGAWSEQALATLTNDAFDLIVLNLESSGANAVRALQSIRQTQCDVALIVTTAHASAASAIAAVKANVVDYIVKPYKSRDLLLTISKALDERAQQLKHQHLLSMVSEALEALKQPGVSEPPARPTLAASSARSVDAMRAGEVELDREKRQLIWNVDPVRSVELTESEMTVMVTLMEKPNQVVSCNQLGSALGYQNMDKWTVENVIRSVVFRLRQKIETDSERTRLIHTVRGRGYYFAPA